MLFNIVDITDIACKMIINSSDNDIIIYTVIDVTNLLTLNPILWVFSKSVETPCRKILIFILFSRLKNSMYPLYVCTAAAADNTSFPRNGYHFITQWYTVKDYWTSYLSVSYSLDMCNDNKTIYFPYIRPHSFWILFLSNIKKNTSKTCKNN